MPWCIFCDAWPTAAFDRADRAENGGRLRSELESRFPDPQRTMRRCQGEIVVSGQQRKLVTNTQLRNDGVDRANLEAGATTAIAQVRGIDVILSGWRQKRQGREPVNDVFARPGAGESLQQFLQDSVPWSRPCRRLRGRRVVRAPPGWGR